MITAHHDNRLCPRTCDFTHWGMNRMADILQISFQNALSNKKIGLSSVWQQAITWTNVDHNVWCYITSLGHKELTRLGLVMPTCIQVWRTGSYWFRKKLVAFFAPTKPLPAPIRTLFMMTSSNGNIFRVTGPLCGKFTGPGEFPTQRPVTWSFGVFFDLRLNKRLSKQPWGWWFETPSWSLWRQCNALVYIYLLH